MELEHMFTIKSRYGDDLRRFAVPLSCSFEVLCAKLTKSYTLNTTSFIIKYVDDEGDQISITSTEELTEAFRLCKEQKPPILHLNIFQTQNKIEQVPIIKEEEPVTVVVAPPKVDFPPLELKVPTTTKNYCNEYPPLPVEEWDAPKKAVVVNVTIPLAVLETITSLPISISTQTQNSCTATTREVERLSRETLASTLKSSDGGMVLCSGLSEQIAKECSDLSKKTANICQQLSTIQSEETTRTGSFNKEIGALALDTMQECQRLSAQTAAMCRNLSKATLEICNTTNVPKTQQQQDEIKKQNERVVDLSNDIRGLCDKLSSATTADSLKASAEIRRIVMGL